MIDFNRTPLQFDDSVNFRWPLPGAAATYQTMQTLPRDNTIARLKEVLPHPNTAVQGMRPKGGGEVGGPCPLCGGEDRFFIRADGSFGCRQCKPKGGDKIDFFCWLYDTNVKGLAVQYLDSQAPAKPKLEPARAILANMTAEYIYQDATGAEIYRVRRYEEPGRKKNFIQGRMVGGDWKPGVKDKVDLVLYRLPEVLATGQIVLVEGEKNADDVRALGLVATTNPGGATKWQDSFTHALWPCFASGPSVIW